jgi:predicted secreted protein
MIKRLILVGMLTLFAAGAAFAGDVAQFVNLGFSADSRYFTFGQFGVLQKNSAPYAELYVVDVQKNNFVGDGARKVAYEKPVEPGYDGEGALFNLLEESLGLAKQYKTDHLLTGRLLYLLVDGSAASDTVEFRDFITGKTYSVSLIQSATEKGKEVSSSFHIKFTIREKDATIRSLDVGTPSLKRAGVKSYHIKQIILAPDGKSLVFIIQREEQDEQGGNIRYMVETVQDG